MITRCRWCGERMSYKDDPRMPCETCAEQRARSAKLRPEQIRWNHRLDCLSRDRLAGELWAEAEAERELREKAEAARAKADAEARRWVDCEDAEDFEAWLARPFRTRSFAEIVKAAEQEWWHPTTGLTTY